MKEMIKKFHNDVLKEVVDQKKERFSVSAMVASRDSVVGNWRQSSEK
jgi:hypothetical protein